MQKQKLKNICKIGAATLILLAAGGGFYYAESRPAQYRTTSVHTRDLVMELTAVGNVKTQESRTYYAQVSAPIAQMDLQVGDEIKAGDMLVSYDLEDLTRAKDRSALLVQQADSAYQSTVKQNEKNTMIYEGAVVTEEMFCQMIADQWSVIEELQKKLAKADDKQEEVNYYINRAASETDDDDRDDFNAMVDARHKDYQSMNRPQLAAELAKQQAIYSDMQAFRAQYASQRENADSRLIDESAQKELLLKKKEAELQSADDAGDLTDAEDGVWSDFRGIVTERYVESGATVTKGAPLFTIENLDTIYVAADVSKYDIDSIKVGQPAQIQIGGRSYEGKVLKIDRLASTEHSDKAKIPVRVGFVGNADDVCLGIEADVTITLAEADGVPAIDRKAVYEDASGSYVYVLQDGVVARKPVETGITGEEDVQIVDGLTEGEAVILDAVTDREIGTKGAGLIEEEAADGNE